MSGGSYNYLYQAVPEVPSNLAAMADAVAALGGPTSRASRDISRLLDLYDEADALWRRLEDVMRAVEWFESCDSTEEDARAAINKYARAEEAPL